MNEALQADRPYAVTTNNSIDKSIDTVILDYLTVCSLTTKQIERFVPRIDGIRTKYTFHLLLVLYRLKRANKTNVVRLYNSGDRSVSFGIDQLHHMGYLKMVDTPRLIIPFGAYKIDKAYIVTAKGKKLINDVISYAMSK